MVEGISKCKKCDSSAIVKNGCNASGNPRYLCKTCGFSGVIKSRHYQESMHDLVVRASQERCSSRGLARIFGISHQTALRWIKKSEVG